MSKALAGIKECCVVLTGSAPRIKKPGSLTKRFGSKANCQHKAPAEGLGLFDFQQSRNEVTS
jgi:hypothetical protein